MKNNETLILALGLNAQNVVNLVYKDNSDIDFLCLDYEKQVINTSKAKTIWYNNLKFQKDKYDFEEYKNVLLNRTSKFNGIIKDYKNILIISYIGENYSSYMLFDLIEYFKKYKIKYNIFLIKPSDYNSRKENDIANKVLDKINSLEYLSGKDLFIFDSNVCIKERPKSINKATSIINNKASEAIKLILETV